MVAPSNYILMGRDNDGITAGKDGVRVAIPIPVDNKVDYDLTALNTSSDKIEIEFVSEMVEPNKRTALRYSSQPTQKWAMVQLGTKVTDPSHLHQGVHGTFHGTERITIKHIHLVSDNTDRTCTQNNLCVPHQRHLPRHRAHHHQAHSPRERQHRRATHGEPRPTGRTHLNHLGQTVRVCPKAQLSSILPAGRVFVSLFPSPWTTNVHAGQCVSEVWLLLSAHTEVGYGSTAWHRRSYTHRTCTQGCVHQRHLPHTIKHM